MATSIARQAGRDNEIVLMRGERIEVGVDVHKRSYSVTFWSERRQAVVSRWTQPADAAGLIGRLGRYEKQIGRVVYEAGPTGYTLARALREAGFRAEVVAPSRTPTSSGKEAKSDRLDSRKLAMWSAKGLLQPVRVPTLREEGDRQVFRMRSDLVAKRRRIKQQIKSFLLQHGIEEPEGLTYWANYGVQALRQMKLSAPLRLSLDLLLDDLAHYDGQIKKVEAALRKTARAIRHRASVQALRSVPSVGDVTSMAMRTELFAPERFSNGRQVTAMVGLAPFVSRTGETVREGSLMKCGNSRLRTILIEAAWRWRAQDPWAAQTYARLLGNTGQKKKAIVGLARRLLIILWRISVTGEPYRPPPVEPPQAKKGKPHRLRQPNNTTPSTRRRRPPASAPQ